ncbi:MAG: hypothetical protein ACK5PP_07460 [Acidimicrobiales bacterium]
MQVILGYVLVAVVIAWLAASCRPSGDPPVQDYECPAVVGVDGEFVVFLGTSQSETSSESTERRLAVVAEVAAEAADCEGVLRVVVEHNGRLEVLIDESLSSSLNTERARDLGIPATVSRIMTALEGNLAPYLAEPAGVSDPGQFFRYLAERLEVIPSGIEATVLSDGITSTGTVSLNREIEPDEVGALAEAVAPQVDLGGRVNLDWREMGVTVDRSAPPGTYLTRLTEVWRTVCETRIVAECRISTAAGPAGHEPAQSGGPGILLLAAAILSRTAPQRVGVVRALLPARELHVQRGRALARQAEAARETALTRRPALEQRVRRPAWLTTRVQWVMKVLLLCAEVSAGAAALYTGGDHLLFAIITFAGVAAGTVLAGHHVGVAARREGEPSRLVLPAVATVLLVAGMLAGYRGLLLGPAFALLAGVTIAVAMGSALLAYAAWDPAADTLHRDEQQWRRLAAATMAEVSHPTVQKFERTYAALRMEGADALSIAMQEALTGPRSAVPRPADRLPGEAPGGVTDEAIDRLMAMVVGPEILELTPIGRPAGEEQDDAD